MHGNEKSNKSKISNANLQSNSILNMYDRKKSVVFTKKWCTDHVLQHTHTHTRTYYV